MEGIISTAITGVLSFLGVLFTNIASNRKIEHRLETEQAVTNTKIEELTREVRMHNNFAQRVPVIEEQVKVINHRLTDLEKKGE